MTGPFALNNNVTFQTTNGSGAIFATGTITGSSNITVAGGTALNKFLIISANDASTFTGNILVKSFGELKFNGVSNAFGTSTALTLDSTSVMDIGALSQTFAGLNDAVTGAGGSQIINAGTGVNGVLTLGGSGNYSFSGTIIDGGSLLKSGTGTQTLAGANTYTGGTTVQAGTLVAGISNSGSTSGAFGPSADGVTLGNSSSNGSSNPTLFTGGAYTVSNPITVSSNNAGTYTIGGNTANTSSFSGSITLNNNLTVSQVSGGTLNLTGNITSGSSGTKTLTFNNAGAVSQSTGVIGGGTGTLAVSQTGTGTTTLSGANTYAGSTTVNGGTLQAGATGAFGTGAGAMVVNTGGALDLNGFNLQVGSLSGTGGTITNNNATASDPSVLTVNNLGTATTYAGVIQNGSTNTTGLTLASTDVGTLILTGANTYSGPTTINGGALQLGNGTSGNDGSISASSAISDNSALVYDLFGAETYGGSISGTGALTKTGSGTLTLTNASSYSGTTTVTAGTLALGSGACFTADWSRAAQSLSTARSISRKAGIRL